MNKKLFTAIFALVIVFALLAFAGCTTDDDSDVTDPGNGTDTTDPGEETDQNSEFNFSELSDGSYMVTGFSDDYDGAAEIVIPSEHNGKPVTAIGDHVFACFCIEIHACLQAGGRRQEEVYSATSEVSRYGKCKPDSLLHDDFIQFFSGVGEHHDGGWEFSVCFVFGCAVCALGARNVRF